MKKRLLLLPLFAGMVLSGCDFSVEQLKFWEKKEEEKTEVNSGNTSNTNQSSNTSNTNTSTNTNTQQQTNNTTEQTNTNNGNGENNSTNTNTNTNQSTGGDTEEQGTYLITFAKITGDESGTELTDSNVSEQVTAGSQYISSYSDLTKVYAGKKGLKVGSSKGAGSITFNFNSSKVTGSIKSVSIKTAAYSDKEANKFTVYANGASSGTEIKSGESGTITLSGSLSKLKFEAEKRAYIDSITISCGEGSSSTGGDPTGGDPTGGDPSGGNTSVGVTLDTLKGLIGPIAADFYGIEESEVTYYDRTDEDAQGHVSYVDREGLLFVSIFYSDSVDEDSGFTFDNMLSLLKGHIPAEAEESEDYGYGDYTSLGSEFVDCYYQSGDYFYALYLDGETYADEGGLVVSLDILLVSQVEAYIDFAYESSSDAE